VRRAAKVDANHAEIVGYFRKFGCSVLNISQLKNCGDLVVAKCQKTVIVEVKDGSKPPSARKLTKGEGEFSNAWQGIYAVVEDLSDVIALVKALEKK
jgi:hypothetical protein